jgi:hypothetical protein
MPSNMRPDPDQFEFDLVSPWLAPPSAKQLDAVRRSGAVDDLNDQAAVEKLASRLDHLDLVYNERGVSLRDELEQVRVLIGESEWQRTKKLWKCRAKRDPGRLRKIILLAKQALKLI